MPERITGGEQVMKNALDFKAALLARHAQHIVLIHFPIALFIAAVVFDYLAQWKKSQALLAAAYFNLLLAAISTIPVLLTGVAAWQWALEGQKLKGVLLMHLIGGCTSAVLIWMVFLLHRRARSSSAKSSPNLRLVLETLSLFVVGLTAHLGGFLSGVNGPA
jgi:uncharacterized membrane protein